MRKKITQFEIILSAISLFLGLRMLYAGSLGKDAIAAGISMIGGAFFLMLGAVILLQGVKAARSHRQMLRHLGASQELDGTASQHNRT
jgi:hypothetical protein